MSDSVRLLEAVAILRETVAKFPDDPVSRSALALTLRDLGHFDEAEALYRETLALFPQMLPARSGLAEVLRSAGRLEEALAVDRETLDQFPHDVVARIGFAETLVRLGRFDEALDTYHDTASKFPGDLLAQLGLADTLARLGRFDESIETLRRVVAQFPDNIVARNALAETLRRSASTESGGEDEHTSQQSAYRYQIALSFAGEDRGIASKIAALLRTRGVSVFYDEYEQATLWGKDLNQHLASVYGEQAQYCVIIISRHYAAKIWPRHELRQAQARALRAASEYILPLRIDGTPLPGLPDTTGYLDLRLVSPAQVVEFLIDKLGSVAQR